MKPCGPAFKPENNRKLRISLWLLLALVPTSSLAEELLLGNHLYLTEALSCNDEAEGDCCNGVDDCCLRTCRCLPCRAVCEPNSGQLGEASTLMKWLCPGSEPRITVAGWQQLGFTEQSTGLFNTNPDRVNLHQSWLYAERVASTRECDLDWGFRADFMYGTDADDTQAFGNDPGVWDFRNGFDFGTYGWALPQLYAEIAYQDISLKLGHFYTIMGYEVVTSPDNFFFSRAYTMYNSEPFTHTGVLATYTPDEHVTIYSGWTLGWDTGFDQRNDGASFLGGVRIAPYENLAIAYTTSIGNLGDRGSDAYTHSIILDLQLNDKLNYVVESDLVRVGSSGEDNVGLNQFLFYTWNAWVTLGARLEWWKADDVTGFDYGSQTIAPTSSSSYYEATLGVNIRPHANLRVRPELRYDWAPYAGYTQSVFGMDLILTY